MVATNEQKSYYLFHRRTKEGFFFDGTVSISSQDPTRGFVDMTLLILGNQGQSATTHIELNLTIQGATPPPSQGSGSLPIPDPWRASTGLRTPSSVGMR